MRGIGVVFRKECRENLRDRRSLFNALLWGPLLMPVLFFGQLFFIAKQVREVWESPPSVAVVGAEHAPNLVGFLKRQGAEIRLASNDPARAVREQREEVVLVIPEEFARQWESGEPAAVELIYDETRRQSDSRQQRLRRMLTQYSQSIGSLRLRVRGLDPAVAFPIRIEDRNIGEGGRGSAVLAAFLPFVLMFAAFMGGFYLAVDTTAGERERQSLESLLVNPVPRLHLVLGKMAATVAFSAGATLIGILAFASLLAVADRFALLDVPGLELSVTAGQWALLAGLLLPVVLLASGLQTLIAAFSRSFREAQTYVQFLMFVPMVPFFIITFNPVRPQWTDMLVPFWSQTVLIDRLFRGESAEPMHVAICCAATVVVAIAVTLKVWRMYRDEKLLFGS